MLQQTIPTLSEPQQAERWRKYEPMIREDLKAAEIDPDDPPTLTRALAKTITREAKRGIFLLGRIGSGKTRRLQYLHDIKQVAMIPAMEFGDAWACNTDNPEEFKDFCRCAAPRWDVVPRTYNDLIIDDLGTEAEKYVSYGNFCDVMRDLVIPMRYNAFKALGARTHFTSNLTKDQIKERYGDRCFSRLCEMCGFIYCTHTDRRLGK